MKTVKTYGDGPLLSKGEYEVWIAADSDEVLPSYHVINTTTGVVEFKNENLFFVRDWFDHFLGDDKKLQAVEDEIVANFRKN